MIIILRTIIYSSLLEIQVSRFIRMRRISTEEVGHGFKFTPNIGREILRIIQRKGDPEYTRRWAFGGSPNADSDERYGVRQVLRTEDLATSEDLKG